MAFVSIILGICSVAVLVFGYDTRRVQGWSSLLMMDGMDGWMALDLIKLEVYKGLAAFLLRIEHVEQK